MNLGTFCRVPLQRRLCGWPPFGSQHAGSWWRFRPAARCSLFPRSRDASTRKVFSKSWRTLRVLRLFCLCSAPNFIQFDRMKGEYWSLRFELRVRCAGQEVVQLLGVSEFSVSRNRIHESLEFLQTTQTLFIYIKKQIEIT